MSIKREAILTMLAAGLALQDMRNTVLMDFKGEWRSLLDGDLQLVEEFINGPIFEWQAKPVLVLAVEGNDALGRNQAMADLIDRQLILLEAVKIALLAAGLAEDLRIMPPDFEANQLWGASGVKAAELAIEIDYHSDQSVG